MRATAVIFATLLAVVICQNFPSTSHTWKNEGNNERTINITGTDATNFTIGFSELSISIPKGQGTLFYGIDDRIANMTVSGSSITYMMVVPFCSLGGSSQGIKYFVSLDSSVDLSYEITLTHTSSELPNNESRSINEVPDAFKKISYFIPSGDKDVSKNITISVLSGVTLESYMGVAMVEALSNCAAESSQNQTFSVPANSTTWTFNAQFDAGFENYIVTFLPSEKTTVFSSFYVTANVHLGSKPNGGLGDWLYLIIGVAAAIVVAGIIGIVLYVRSRKGYTKIQDSN